MFKSATIKLTLWYVLLIMGLSFLFSVVLYDFSTSELAEGLHDQYAEIVFNDHDADDRTNTSSQELGIRSQNLLDNLIYFNILVLLGSGLASYLLARRTLRPIEAAHQTQVRFTADASHELRTPLTAMKADTEATLMRGPKNVVMLRRTLEENLGDIEKLDKLTGHLLEISRLDNRTTTAKKVIDLDRVIREVLKTFSRRIRSSNLKIEVKMDEVHILGDPHGIYQLITIILDNAVKYSEPNDQIHLVLSKKSREVIITIKDEGIGIPADDLPHIFERFYRSKNVGLSKKKTTGYGLGLPLAKDIVEQSKGSITVNSKEHEGTTVTISLPRK